MRITKTDLFSCVFLFRDEIYNLSPVIRSELDHKHHLYMQIILVSSSSSSSTSVC